MAKAAKPVDIDNGGITVDVEETDIDALIPEDETSGIINRGLKDMQTAIYEHASRIKPRLTRQDKIMDLIEERIFQKDMLQALPSKELVKLLELLMNSQAQSAGFLERLYKMTLQSKELELLSMTESYAASGKVTERSAARLKIDPERKSLLLKVIEHNLLGDQTDEDGD